MQRNIFTYILRYSIRQQLAILVLTLLALPFYYASLELPKRIINQAIDAEPDRFPRALEVFRWTIGGFGQLEWLVLLCGVFLFLVLVNNTFKYVINVYKGLLGERMLRRLRYQLFERLFWFPLARFRSYSSGDIVPIIAGEVEPLGGFIGDAFSLPLYQGGLLATALGFIFAQDTVMGVSVIALYPIQVAIIPRLQAQVNQLSKERVQEVRKLSNRITRAVDLAREVRLNRTARFELAGFSEALGRIFHIRQQIFRKRSLIKFLNNLLTQITPFLFFLLGGYLVIQKQLSLGELVAVLAAYREMTPPWRELLGYYQNQQNASVRYEQIVAQFDIPGLETAAGYGAAWEDRTPLAPGDLVVRNVSYFEDGEARLKNISFTLRVDEHVAIIGDGDSGSAFLADVLAGLKSPATGKVTIAHQGLHDIPAGLLARYAAYVDGEPGFVSGTLFDNLVYGLMRFPEAGRSDANDITRRRMTEAHLAGNSSDDPDANWIDYESLGAKNTAEVEAEAITALETVALQDGLIGFGLRARIDPETEPDLAAIVLTMRKSFSGRVTEKSLLSCIAPFDENAFNENLSIGQNLLFGAPTGPGLDPHRLANSRFIRRLLKRFDLDDALLRLGYHVAGQVRAQSMAGVSEDDVCKVLPVQKEDIAQLRLIAGFAEGGGPEKSKRKVRHFLQSVALKLIPSHHVDPIIDEVLKTNVVAARRELRKSPLNSLVRSVNFFDRKRFIPELTLRENILFGEIEPNNPKAANRVNRAIDSVIEACGARAVIVRAALQFQVGRGASALGATERQQLAIARALLKRPHLLILSGATTDMAAAVEKKVLKNLRAAQSGKQLVCFFADRSPARLFERTIHLKNGALAAAPGNQPPPADPPPNSRNGPDAAG